MLRKHGDLAYFPCHVAFLSSYVLPVVILQHVKSWKLDTTDVLLVSVCVAAVLLFLHRCHYFERTEYLPNSFCLHENGRFERPHTA